MIKIFGKETTDAIIESLKRPPGRYYLRVNTLKVSRGQLLSILRQRGFNVYPDEVLLDSIYLIVKGPYDVPRAKKEVIADKFAAESVVIGANLYGPGVLEADKDINIGDEVVILNPLGDEVAFGIARMTGIEMNLRKKGLAVEVLVSRYKTPSLRELKEYKQGLFYEQSLPAILTSWVLRPYPDEVVVDMCAAPGGKTTHIAQLMENEGVIYAFENSPKRAKKLEENLSRLGIKNVKIMVHDSRYIHIDFPCIKADKVLLDPPCSALGVRPKLYEKKSLRDVIGVMKYQRQFLKAASRVIKKGGYLVYSTCTITLEENEINIKYAIENLGFKLEEQWIVVGSSGLVIDNADMLQRFYPHLHDTPGYFIALLSKS